MRIVRPLFAFFLLLITWTTALAQAELGRVSGKVLLPDGTAAELAAIQEKGTTNGTSTDAEGNFQLSASPGPHTLLISLLGFEKQEVLVDVTADQNTTLPEIRLRGGQHQLQEVQVVGARTLNEQPVSVGKMPVRPLDLPQSVVSLAQPVLEQQQVLRVSDVLANVSGVYVMGTTGGTQEEVAGRGFAFNSNNTFKNGVRYNNGVMPEASALERFEVLKGSNAILYGNVAAGGVLNLVTKKPRFEQGGSVGARVGSFGFYKPMLDLYGAVNGSDRVAYRLNTSYEKAGSFRKNVESERFYVNPSLLVKTGEKTELLLEGDYLSDNRTPDFGIGAISYRILNVPRSQTLNTPWATNRTRQKSTTLTLTHHFSSSWQVRGLAAYQDYDNRLLSATRPSTIRDSVTVGPLKGSPALYGNLGRNAQRSETRESYYLGQVDLTGQFGTGPLRHTLLLGMDADQYHTRALTFVAAAYDSINVFNLAKPLAQPAVRADVWNLQRNQLSRGNTRRVGVYAQDLISISEKLKVLAGLRWTYLETPTDVLTYKTGETTKARLFDDAFTPRLGLVYQPVKTTALFASYANSFTLNTGLNPQGQALEPSFIDQFEAGVKNDLFAGLLSANLTAYKIVNSNLAQPYTGNGNTNTNIKELAGEVTSYGLEADVQSQPYHGWSLISGYSYNRTTYTKSNLYQVGSLLRYNPTHTANLSLSYQVEEGFLKGLSAGVLAYYVGERQAGRSTTEANPHYRLIALPAYTQLDATLGYTFNRISLRMKLANVLNELSYNVHDDNSVNPISPRNFSATLSYKL